MVFHILSPDSMCVICLDLIVYVQQMNHIVKWRTKSTKCVCSMFNWQNNTSDCWNWRLVNRILQWKSVHKTYLFCWLATDFHLALTCIYSKTIFHCVFPFLFFSDIIVGFIVNLENQTPNGEWQQLKGIFSFSIISFIQNVCTIWNMTISVSSSLVSNNTDFRFYLNFFPFIWMHHHQWLL